MNIASCILKRLGSFTGMIFRSTEIPDSKEEPDIMGRSFTDPFAYGLIFKVMGESLTDFSLYEEEKIPQDDEVPGNRETLTEVDWMEIDEEAEDEFNDCILPQTAIAGIGQKDFELLEECLSGNNDKEAITVLDSVSRMKGTGLYEALQGNNETRSRIASLLSKVETEVNGAEAKTLFEMTDFLTTK